MTAEVGSPLEISLPPSDALGEWVLRDMPSNLLEQQATRRLPAETVFLFRPLAAGIGILRFVKKVPGGGPVMSETESHEVEVMILSPASATTSKAVPRPGPKMPPGGPRGGVSSEAAATPPHANPLILDMLTGQLGFPAKNPEPSSADDTDAAMRRKNPLPYSLSYVLPSGSYLLNPTHRMPLPDTPPGVDTPPAAYHQALALANRGLLKEAAKVLEELVKEEKEKGLKGKSRMAADFYEFVKAHLALTDGDYPEAIKKFQELVPTKDFGVAARFYTGLAMENSGDTLGAISAYQGVVSHHPTGFFASEAAWRICRIFYNAQAYERAIHEYANFISDKSTSAYIDDAYMDLARIYDQVYDHQDFDVSIRLYDALIQQYPESAYHDSAVARRKFIQENYF